MLIASQQPFNFDWGKIAGIEFTFVYFLRQRFGGGSFSQSWLTDITPASAAPQSFCNRKFFTYFAARMWSPRCNHWAGLCVANEAQGDVEVERSRWFLEAKGNIYIDMIRPDVTNTLC